MPRTWLVTGCSRGLGRQLAEAVLMAGHNLVATARRPEVLADLVARHPGRACATVLDVRNRAQAADDRPLTALCRDLSRKLCFERFVSK